MRAYWTLTGRELASFFFSITGYIIIAAAALLTGFGFVVLLAKMQNGATPMPVTEVFYLTPFFWMILILSVPVITMRLFALEKFSGTFETLMTTPVSDLQVVAAKFTAALIFYLALWLPLLGCLLILRRYVGDPAGFATGSIVGTFVGILLLGYLFISVGTLASALTRSQMVAAMISLVFCVGLFFLNFLTEKVPAADWQSQVLSCFALLDQMHDFTRGVVDTRPMIFCASISFFFLFLTLRILESRRWK